MKLNEYVTLGRSGLRVSPLCLGTMTFGREWGWGSDEGAAAAILDHYLEAGGNFLDTADMYVDGRSEEMLGRFIAERRARDRVVLATKFTFNAEPAIRTPAATGARTSTARSKARSAACGRTTWTSTGCTPGTPSRRSTRC